MVRPCPSLLGSTWVRGHAGHEQNERVDDLANSEAVKAAEASGWTPGARFGFAAE